jgi:hypothetical protein
MWPTVIIQQVLREPDPSLPPQDPAKKKIGATAMSGTKDPSSDFKRTVPQTPIIVNWDRSYYSEMADRKQRVCEFPLKTECIVYEEKLAGNTATSTLSTDFLTGIGKGRQILRVWAVCFSFPPLTWNPEWMPLQGADRPPLGIRPPHTAHSHHSHAQRVDPVENLHAVWTEAPIRNVRSVSRAHTWRLALSRLKCV